MASAIIGGLTSQGHPASQIEVVEPWDQARAALRERFGIEAAAAPGPQLARAALIVWAVKPQTFKEAALAAAPHTGAALHLSVAAGITTASIAAWLGSERIIRAMPNTPALVGRGMTGLFAGEAVAAEGRALAERIVATTGQWLWVDTEDKLDAVTALSGSGPAYVFLFLEAMIQAGTDMGLTPAQAHQLAVATFQGAAELAARSGEAPEVMRQRVTSQGGTTANAFYIDNRIDVGNWTITPGVRYERIRSFNNVVDYKGATAAAIYPTAAANELLPTLSVLYRVDSHWSVFANAGKSFGPQQYAQLAQSSNNQLYPESAKTYELGTHYKSDTWNGELTLFNIDFNKELFLDRPGDGTGNGIWTDLGATRHRGLESALRYDFGKNYPALKGLSLGMKLENWPPAGLDKR